MRVFHVSLRRHHGSIVRLGIDPMYSRGKMMVSWFVTERMLPWAILHVMKRHQVPLSEVIAFECLVDKKHLSKRRKGIYTCQSVVDPLFFLNLQDAEQVAVGTPIEATPEGSES